MKNQDIENKVVEQDETARNLATIQRLRQERKLLQRKLRKADEWLPLYKLEHSDQEARVHINYMRNRILEIQKQEASFLKNHKAVKRRWVEPEPLPDRSSAALTGDCPRGRAGTINHPTDFRAYKWDPPSDGWRPDGNGGFLWTYVRRANRLERREGKDWIEVWPVEKADAVAFSAGVGTDKALDGMSFILCLEYRFPTFPCDGILAWNTHGRGCLPNGLEITAEGGALCFDIVIHEQSRSAGFPDFEKLEWVENKCWNYEFSNWGAKNWDLGGTFDVFADVQSALFIGLAVQLRLWDGNPPWSGMVCTENCISSPDDRLWHEGIFSLGYPGVPCGYVYGVKYEIVP
ncbi:MAG: hypothetical protein ACFFDT_12100, partial [Candidatus Hodarchaeota archaeon]